MNDLQNKLKAIIKGDVLSDDKALKTYSHDASIFEVKPQVVVFPKDAQDIKALIKFVIENKMDNPDLSLTARSAGTDMSGGPLNDSIIIEFSKYFDKIKVNQKLKTATSQPGTFYRDFEKETLKDKLIFPSYPASKDICAIGGIVSNNSGGEKSLEYGKTEKYVEKIKVILSDGNEYEFKKINEEELREKLLQQNLEGRIYREIHSLIINHLSLITDAKPRVSKNSAGYLLWNVYSPKEKTFDLSQLFVGSQGTLGILTEATFKLVPVKTHSKMVVIFLEDMKDLGEIINDALEACPESIEGYDDNTVKVAMKYYGENFLPDLKKIPKLVLQIEFNEDDQHLLNKKINSLTDKLSHLKETTKILDSKNTKKYWTIRRESFNLLRKHVPNMYAAPFIDDIVVSPSKLPEFLPKLHKILNKYPSLIHTVAGHFGDGNFHIIPLMDISKEEERKIIPILSKEVFDLVLEYKGSITGEHNDGIIRTPYLKQMYGENIYKLFEETKKIFDPLNIFNPGKKVGGSLEYSINHIRTSFT